MPSLEQRIQTLEDRQALQELVSSYLIALDDAADLEQLLNHFTEDAVFDMTALDYPTFEGKAELRELFTGAFASMNHSAHYATNLRLIHWSKIGLQRGLMPWVWVCRWKASRYCFMCSII